MNPWNTSRIRKHLDIPFADSVFDKVCRFSEPQFAPDVDAVLAYGADAYVEKLGDLHGRFSFRDEL
jgi:ABC-type Zn2+ transport system substrate-binding protein/surface adhesin